MASILNVKGRWRAHIRKVNHKVCRTFDTEEEARLWAAEEEERITSLVNGYEGNPFKGASAYRIAGVYILLIGKEVRYVGRSTHIYRRLNDHDRKAMEWDRFQIWPMRDSIRAADLEQQLIRRFKPPLNVAHNVPAKQIRKRKGRSRTNFTAPNHGAHLPAPPWYGIPAQQPDD